MSNTTHFRIDGTRGTACGLNTRGFQIFTTSEVLATTCQRCRKAMGTTNVVALK